MSEVRDLDAKMDDLVRKLDDSFVEEVKTSTPERLKELIVKFSQEIEEIDCKKAEDQKLNTLKAQVSDLNGGYKDAKKAVSLKLQLSLLTLQIRGKI